MKREVIAASKIITGLVAGPIRIDVRKLQDRCGERVGRNECDATGNRDCVVKGRQECVNAKDPAC